MKKLLLLLAAGSIAMNVGAQELKNFTAGRVPASEVLTPLHRDNAVGAKKTTGPTAYRWYSFSQYMNLKAVVDRGTIGASPDYIATDAQFLWKDTVGLIGYSNLTEYNTFLCIGSVMNPTFNGFNRTDLYDAVYGAGTYLMVKPADTYTLDSVYIGGVYNGTGAPGVVDTLRIAILHDVPNPATSSTIFTNVTYSTVTHYGKINPLEEEFDTVRVVPRTPLGAGTYGGSNPVTYVDVLLKSGDQSSSLLKHGIPMVEGSTPGKGQVSYDLSSGDAAHPIACGAGSVLSATASFITGDPAAQGAGILTHLPGDTLMSFRSGTAKYYHNTFRMLYSYYSATDPSSTPQPPADWAPYYADNEGLFFTIPYSGVTGGNYRIPAVQWIWTSGTSAASLQYPEVEYYLHCASCVAVPENVKTPAIVNNVTATPNPASNELNITFTLAQASNVSVSLTNMVGQVVAAKNMGNAANGTAVFNTSALASGVYMYTVNANGETSIGRVVVAH